MISKIRWLNEFRIRHSRFKAISGEEASFNAEYVAAFWEKFLCLLNGYLPRDNYSTYETGLYFRALPNKTLTFKKKKSALLKSCPKRG